MVSDGRVSCIGDERLMARANIMLRIAERVLIELGSFRAESFSELFDNVSAMPFENFIGSKDAFPVKGWSLNSKLHSVPDCQSIIKKAIVNRLEKKYGVQWFEESGPARQIQFSIMKDMVSISIDTSGAGLHKRGYRPKSLAAPIKETLAAGIADLARVREDSLVLDPMCGSGTLLIEAAMKAMQIPPGLKRRFAAESWGVFPKSVWQQERRAGYETVRRSAAFRGMGWDIDENAVLRSRENAAKAGVASRIAVEQADISRFTLPDQPCIVICNPPYGERMLEVKAAEALYHRMGEAFKPGEGRSFYIISPHDRFEHLFGRAATKRRKLYNGMIKCQLFMFF